MSRGSDKLKVTIRQERQRIKDRVSKTEDDESRKAQASTAVRISAMTANEPSLKGG